MEQQSRVSQTQSQTAQSGSGFGLDTLQNLGEGDTSSEPLAGITVTPSTPILQNSNPLPTSLSSPSISSSPLFTMSVKIPEAWDRNAPHFDSSKPEELQQFLDHMDSLMDKAATPEEGKKDKLVSYADYNSKREWMSLPSYQKGSYEDFVKDIINHYPSIRDSEKGSISILNKLLVKFANRSISMEDQDELMDLIRPMQAQVKRLVPAKLTNKSAIARFLEKLDTDFVNRIWARLDMDEVVRNQIPIDQNDAAAVAARTKQLKDRETERYLFEEVVTVAKDLASGSTDREEYDFGASNYNTEGIQRKNIKSEVTAATSALEKRTEAAIERMEQWQVQMLDKFELSQRRMEQFMKSVNSNGSRQGEVPSSQTVNRPMTLAEIICHYCRFQGHMVGNCEHRRKHIEEGLLKIILGRDCLADGTPLYVPKDGRSKKEFVENYFKKSQNFVGTTAGVYNLSTDMEEALFSNGTNYDPRDDEILSRTVTEANLRRQLVQLTAQLNQGQGERATQLVQQQQPTGVVQPAPMAPASQSNEVAQAITLMSTTLQKMDQKMEQFVVQTRASASRTGNSPNNEGF